MGGCWVLAGAVLLQGGDAGGRGSWRGGGRQLVGWKAGGNRGRTSLLAFVSPGDVGQGAQRIRYSLMSETNLTKAIEELRNTPPINNFLNKR
eukprot:753370-Hanusia_phi.AAC.1